ncbi:MAG: hypothetical protein ACRDKZ_11105 [Actinomycetota bacterium]
MLSALLLVVAVPLADPIGTSFRGFIEAATYATVGAVVASRHPENPVGWLFSALGVVVAFEFFGTEYVAAGRSGGTGLPGAQWLAWATKAGTEISIPLVVFVLLLFPHGRLLSPGWRVVGYSAAAAGLVGATATVLLSAGRASSFASSRGSNQDQDVLRRVMDLHGGALGALLVAATVCVILRQRRAVGDERQQLKWFTYAVALVIATAVVGTSLTGGNADLALWVTPAIPITAGIAILKYRLYDIDLIINRTLVYMALTALLGAVYIAGVFLLQQLLSPVTEESSLAVAGSTISVAALFRPARSAVQGRIDRHFYRAKYDARATLEAFAARVQHEADLQELTDELLSVVRVTVQPNGASLWLREIGNAPDDHPRRR